MSKTNYAFSAPAIAVAILAAFLVGQAIKQPAKPAKQQVSTLEMPVALAPTPIPTPTPHCGGVTAPGSYCYVDITPDGPEFMFFLNDKGAITYIKRTPPKQ